MPKRPSLPKGLNIFDIRLRPGPPRPRRLRVQPPLRPVKPISERGLPEFSGDATHCLEVRTTEHGERYRLGDRVYVEIDRAARNGGEACLIRRDADGTIHGLLRQNVRRAGDKWVVETLSPQLTHELTVADWPFACRVVGAALF